MVHVGKQEQNNRSPFEEESRLDDHKCVSNSS